jgi:hypothetical protein
VKTVEAPLSLDGFHLSVDLSGKQDVLAVASPAEPHAKLVESNVVKSLIAGANVSLTSAAETVTIAAADPAVQTVQAPLALS